MDKVNIIDHPLVQDKLTRLRDKNTGSRDFRKLLKELSMLMAFEVTRDLKGRKVKVTTPLEEISPGVEINNSDIALVAILRAGVGMTDGVMEVIPQARIGHIGIYRNPENLEAVEYYQKLPVEINKARMVIIIDPMLATGHTMVATLDICRRLDIKNIRIMCLVAAPEGVREVKKYYSRIPIYTAALDSSLDDHGYILPGLGDAGDRIFGTK